MAIKVKAIERLGKFNKNDIVDSVFSFCIYLCFCRQGMKGLDKCAK